MAKEIEPKLQTIGVYLRKTDIFTIPEYQRAYSWTTSHCDKLWLDVENYISQNAEDPYFFGTIIIDCSTAGRLNLIDGQQRTTTFFLLLKAMHLRIVDVLEIWLIPKKLRVLSEAYNRVLMLFTRSCIELMFASRLKLKKIGAVLKELLF